MRIRSVLTTTATAVLLWAGPACAGSAGAAGLFADAGPLVGTRVVLPDPVAPVRPVVVYGLPIPRYAPIYIVDQGPSYTVPAVPYSRPFVYPVRVPPYGYVPAAAYVPGVAYAPGYGHGYGAARHGGYRRGFRREGIYARHHGARPAWRSRY